MRIDKPTIGTAGGATGAIDFKGTTSGTVTLSTADAAGTWTMKLPTSAGSNTNLLQTDGAGVTSWVPAPSGMSWGTSVAAGSGVALTMTSSDLGGGNAFTSFEHTASGTLTSNTTTQSTISTSRTATGGTASDNFIGTLFSRTNVTNGANLTSAGSVVSITGSDTQTANTLTPTYDLLKLTPSLRSTGSSINLGVPNSVVAAPTNGYIYAVLGNTQTVAQVMQKINLGTSAQGHKGLQITGNNASSNAYGIEIINQGKDSRGILFTNSYTGTFSSGILIQVSGGTVAGSSGPESIISYSGLLSGNKTIGNYPNSGHFSTSMEWNNTISSATLTNRTSDYFTNQLSRTNTATTGTIADNYNLGYWKRTSIQNGAGGTFTSDGSVLKLENVATQTAGTLTDTTAVLLLAQSANSTGYLIDGGSGKFRITGKGGNTPRIVTTTDDSTAVIDVTITDQYELTAMATATTISTTGTGLAGQKLIIRLKDNATPRALTWDAIFVPVGVTLPTTTTASKLTYVGCIYNATSSKFDVVAVTTEA